MKGRVMRIRWYLFICAPMLLTFAATASALDWNYCAAENDTCSFSGTKEVRYGANETFSYLILTDGTQCSNVEFGDPAPNVAKHCETSTWTFCTTENNTCSFSGTKQVRYGANG